MYTLSVIAAAILVLVVGKKIARSRTKNSYIYLVLEANNSAFFKQSDDASLQR